MHILFVCTGNTCRSPMAQALMTRFAEEKGLSVTCDSAGVAAMPGSPFSEQGRLVLKDAYGIRDFDHKAKPVTGSMLESADLVIAMTENHRRLLIQAFGAGEKAITIPGEAGDPYGGDFHIYKKAADAIYAGLESLFDKGVFHD